MEGNVKGVMKVILAVAERYQPKSVKPRSEPSKPTNHTAPIPAPTADPNVAGRDLIRPYTHPQTTARLEYGHSLSEPAQGSYHGSAGYHMSSSSHQHVPGPAPDEVYSSPIDQLPANKPPQVHTCNTLLSQLK